MVGDPDLQLRELLPQTGGEAGDHGILGFQVTGVDQIEAGLLGKLDIVVTDPDAVGAQRCVLDGVVFDEFDLGSWENGAVLSESVPFKFADYEFIEMIEG